MDMNYLFYSQTAFLYFVMETKNGKESEATS